jgi:hypothetical protein
MDSEDTNHVTDEYCLAHVGLDQVDCGAVPMNVDFWQELRCCLCPSIDCDKFQLYAIGAGADWHVHYWIGPPEAIPPLMMSRTPQSPSKEQNMGVPAAKQAIENSSNS